MVAAPVTITSGVTLGGGKTLQCLKGVVITKQFDGAEITVTGSHTHVTGCSLDGNKASGFSGTGITVIAADDVEIDHVEIYNQGRGVTAGTAVFLDAASNFNLHDISAHDNDDVPVLVWALQAGSVVGPGLITGNSLFPAVSGGHAIQIAAVATDSVAKEVTVDDNTLTTGNGSCVEATIVPGAAAVMDIHTTNNRCKLTGNAAGCYSYSVVSGGALSHNQCDINGFLAAFPIELARSHQITVDGNDINGTGTASGGIILNSGSSNNTITNDKVRDIAGAGIGISTCHPAEAADDNLISNATITLAGTAQRYCVWLQANADSSSLNRTNIKNVDCTGGGSGTMQQGIRVENNAGLLDSTQIVSNTVRYVGQGIGLARDTNTNCSLNTFIDVPNPIVGEPCGN